MQLIELRETDRSDGLSYRKDTIAQGVIFDNGQCSLCWLGHWSSVNIYSSVEDLVAIHGHEGKRVVVQVVDYSEVVEGLLVTEAQDGFENIKAGLSKSGEYLFEERGKLAKLFHPTRIGT